VQIAWQEALATLKDGHLLAISLGNEQHAADLSLLLHKLQDETKAPILPAFCGVLDETRPPKVRVVFGEIMTKTWSLADCKKAIDELGVWIRDNDDKAGEMVTELPAPRASVGIEPPTASIPTLARGAGKDHFSDSSGRKRIAVIAGMAPPKRPITSVKMTPTRST